MSRAMPKSKRATLVDALWEADDSESLEAAAKEFERAAHRRGFRAGLRKAKALTLSAHGRAAWECEVETANAIGQIVDKLRALLATPKPPKRKSR